jgi:tubulin beta
VIGAFCASPLGEPFRPGNLVSRVNVLYHEAPGGKYLPRAVLFDLEPRVIGTLGTLLLGELLRPENLVNQNAGAGNNWAKGH